MTPVIVVALKSALERSARVRSAPVRFVLDSFTFTRFAPIRSAPARLHLNIVQSISGAGVMLGLLVVASMLGRAAVLSAPGLPDAECCHVPPTTTAASTKTAATAPPITRRRWRPRRLVLFAAVEMPLSVGVAFRRVSNGGAGPLTADHDGPECMPDTVKAR